MKKMAIAFSVLGFVMTLAFASQASAAGAIVVPGSTCGVPGVDADGNLNGALGAVTQDTQKVQNENKTMFICHADVTNDSGRGAKFDGLTCGIINPSGGFIITTDTSLRVSASGQAVLKCDSNVALP